MADTPSPSSRSTEAPANQSTRQLLDELDTLMQRMLAVPVQPADEVQPSARGEPAPGLEPEAGVQAESLPRPAAVLPVPPPVTVAAPPVELPQEELVVVPPPLIVRAGPVVDFMPPAEPVESEVSAPAYIPVGAEPLLPIIYKRPKNETPAVPATRVTAPILPPRKSAPEPAPVLPPRKSVPEPAPVVRPAWLNPAAGTAPVQEGWLTRQLQIVNRSYDRATELLGEPGRWLRSNSGRALVGWIGLAMLTVALVWAAVLFLG
jgi:hypothetical protein